MSVAIQKSLPSVVPALQAAVRALGRVFATLAAVGAAAHALENRRQPDLADLRGLGMEGVRFKHY